MSREVDDVPSVLLLRTAFISSSVCEFIAILTAIQGHWGSFAICQFWSIVGYILYIYIRGVRMNSRK